MSEALLDVNLVIASVAENHANHERAQRFLQTLQTFRTTPTTQGGFLRFMTRPWRDEQKRDQPPRMSIAEAFATLRGVVESPKHAFLLLKRLAKREVLNYLPDHDPRAFESRLAVADLGVGDDIPSKLDAARLAFRSHPSPSCSRLSVTASLPRSRPTFFCSAP